jgi:thioredoxin reductase (NADPH)
MRARRCDRNAKRVGECIRSNKLKVIFNSKPVEFTPDAVVLDVGGKLEEIPNDFVWIFAGGMPPKEFLQKIGIQFGMRDVTLEASVPK